MRRLFAIAGCVMALGVGTPPPAVQHPPTGTYHYEVSANSQKVYDSEIRFSSIPAGLVESESVALPQKLVTTQTVFDMRTMQPQHHDVNVLTRETTQVVRLTFGKGFATLDIPPMRFSAVTGTNVLAPDEGLAGFWALAPLYTRLAQWKPFTLVALNGAREVTVTPSVGNDARPADSSSQDVELELTIDRQNYTVWYDPNTLVVDRATLGAAVMRLVESTIGTPAPIVVKTPAPSASPIALARATYAEKEIAFASSGATLRGVLDMPRASRPVAAVVFVHGSGPATRDGGTAQNPTFKDLANTLANSGIAVLRYDKRGIRRSSGTATEDWHVLGSDLKAAVAFLAKQPGIDKSRIFALGHSEGGFIVPKLAPELPLSGIITMAGPAIPMERILAYQTEQISPALKRALEKVMASYMGIDPAAVISRVRVPTLLLQGGKDSQILASDFPRLVRAARAANAAVTAKVFPEDDHLFLVLPATQKMEEERELFEPHPLDPRVGRTIAAWIARLSHSSHYGDPRPNRRARRR